ncbi:MAG: hypothetical protein FD128_2460 [Hyphomonadaceae bacterium]|nr:MAG: hypothetical protein FD128_2460 [Hyphomonadaceae bacterium]
MFFSWVFYFISVAIFEAQCELPYQPLRIANPINRDSFVGWVLWLFALLGKFTAFRDRTVKHGQKVKMPTKRFNSHDVTEFDNSYTK